MHAVEPGIFYQAAKIHSDIFNSCVDIMRQQLSTLADLAMVKDPHLSRTGLPSMF